MIRIRYLDVRLGEFTLTDIDLRIEEGGFFVLMGPTGAGKTVLLEAIAGLVPVQAGGIEIAGRGHENRRGFFAIGPRRSSSAGTRFPAA